MMKKLFLIPLFLMCSCASMYQNMAADNIKDMIISLKTLDNGYASFYKKVSEGILTNPTWLDSAKGKSQIAIINDYQSQMKIYNDTIVTLQKFRDQLKGLAQTFDTTKKLDSTTIQKELGIFNDYRNVLVSMVAIKVPFPDSLSSLAKQICDRNNKIAIFYKLTTSDCEFTSKGLVSFGPNTNQ